jgi:hypothetical protein
MTAIETFAEVSSGYPIIPPCPLLGKEGEKKVLNSILIRKRYTGDAHPSNLRGTGGYWLK